MALIIIYKRAVLSVSDHMGSLWFSFAVYRLLQLVEEIMREKDNKTLIFAQTKSKADYITRLLRKRRYELLSQSSTTLKLFLVMEIQID